MLSTAKTCFTAEIWPTTETVSIAIIPIIVNFATNVWTACAVTTEVFCKTVKIPTIVFLDMISKGAVIVSDVLLSVENRFVYLMSRIRKKIISKN